MQSRAAVRSIAFCTCLALAAPALAGGSEPRNGAAPVVDAVPATPAPVEPRPAESAVPDSKVERTPRAVEGAVEKTGQAVKEVVEKTKSGAKAVARKTGQVVRDVGEKIEGVGSTK